MKKENVVINDIVYYEKLKIVQNKDYFNFSLDSVLLPNFVKIKKNTKMILDLCTGNAPIPIILSKKTDAQIIGIEVQKEIYDLAIKSIELNKLNNVKILNLNAKDIYSIYNTDSFDIITCNPPYFPYSDTSKINDNYIKSVARHEILINLDEIMSIARKMLKNNASIYLIHRTERLIDILESMKKNNIEPKRLQFIYPKKDSESNLFMIEGCKNGNTSLKLLPPLIIHKDNGEYTDEVLKIFGK